MNFDKDQDPNKRYLSIRIGIVIAWIGMLLIWIMVFITVKPIHTNVNPSNINIPDDATATQTIIIINSAYR